MADDPTPVVVKKSNWTTIVTIASILGIFVIFVVALWVAGFLKFTGSDPSSKVVAAALALVGGLVAAIVSIIGIVLKYSIDQRTETRLQIESTRAAAERKAESDRASALQAQAEQRLQLEAAIRAVELLGAPKSGSTTLQRAGALFALSNLNQHQLTIDLASYLLKHNRLEPNMACSLVDRALKSGEESVQVEAINLLYFHAGKMISETDTEAPSMITDWDDCIKIDYVRRMAVEAMSRMLVARPKSIWISRFFGDLTAVVSVFALAWEFETTDMKTDMGAILRAVLKAFPNLGTLFHPKKTLQLDQIAREVADLKPTTRRGIETVKMLNEWAEAEELHKPEESKQA